MDWGARGSATIGGGISTNAGGINVLRYGNTREQVLGLEAVLPDGRVWNGLRALRKDSSGYDLKHLFIGGEGTLGIVTKAVLKLHPRPSHVQTLFGAVADLDRVIELFVLARDVAGPVLSAFELIPGHTYELALKKLPTLQRPVETQEDWYVLVRGSDRAPVTGVLEEFYARAAEAGLLSDGALAQSEAQEANLWLLRDEIPAGQVMTGKMLKWDASVPIDRIIPFLRDVERTAVDMQPGTRAIAFGHVGDGNLHLSIFPRQEGDWKTLFARMEHAIDELIWRYNGSICAEHGIGDLNHLRIVGQKSPLELEMMSRIRSLFDPQGLFNPGKGVDESLLVK
jgi:FAD/FMN-containing dehydrogenase